MNIDLWQEMRRLEPGHGSSFNVIAHPLCEDVYLARDRDGSSICLVRLGEGSQAHDVRLLNISVMHNVAAILKADGSSTAERLSILRCSSDSAEIQRLFVSALAEMLLPKRRDRTGRQLNLAISRLSDLFAELSSPGLPPLGLWAELLIMVHSSDPKLLLSSWHSVKEDRFDFTKGRERLEVKATTGSNRWHDFSLEQLNSPAENIVTVASIITVPRTDGPSIASLHAACLEACTGDRDLRLKIIEQSARYLGAAWPNAGNYRFDETIAVSSLRLIDSRSVPTVSFDVPTEVRSVRFSANLEGCIPLPKTEAGKRPLAAAVSIGAEVARRGE